MNKIINIGLPFAEIKKSALREKADPAGNPLNLHLWWGRCPLSFSIAAISAALLDFSTVSFSSDLKLIAAVSSGNKQAADSLCSKLKKIKTLPLVWDPFAGFGGAALAAQKLGLKAAVNDLNEVAVMLCCAAADIPCRFSGLKPVHPGPFNQKNFSGSQGIAEDVLFYGSKIKERALQQLAAYYPQTESGEVPYAWLWIRSVKCPNPACGCKIPLGNSFILNRTKDFPRWAEPIIEKDHISFIFHDGICPEDKASNKISRQGASFQCPSCKEITTSEYIKTKGLDGEIDAVMLAVILNKDGRRTFISPDSRQLAAAQVPNINDVPSCSIPKDSGCFSVHEFGLTDYSKLYSSRQKLMLTTLSKLISDIKAEAEADAIVAGMHPDKENLESGGTGAYAYAQAIGVYLSFVVDRLALYNSTITTWRQDCGSVRGAFLRDSIPMSWTFAEINPFSTAPGNFSSALASIANSLKQLGGVDAAQVRHGNALTIDFPHNALICTEIPCFRDIRYADLSNYFYIWLRRNLQDTFPKLFEKTAASKGEIYSAADNSNINDKAAEKKYLSDLTIIFRKRFFHKFCV